MLTLDALARMAEGMANEPRGDAGRPPYRRADDSLRLRHVSLPSIHEEVIEALSALAFFVSTAVSVMTAAGLLAMHGGEVASGSLPAPDDVLRTMLWFGGGAALLTFPLAAMGLWREVRRYRRVRHLIGPTGWLHASGWLRSEDGARRCSLHD